MTITERRFQKKKHKKRYRSRKADKLRFVKKTVRSKTGESRDFSKIYRDEIV